MDFEDVKRIRNSSLYASNSIDDSSSTKGRVCVSQEEANGIETRNHNQPTTQGEFLLGMLILSCLGSERSHPAHSISTSSEWIFIAHICVNQYPTS